MKNAAGQTTTKTLADLYRALDHQHAVTITYIKEDGTVTVRTIEIHEIRTNGKGDIEIVAMCRLRASQGEPAERKFTVRRVTAYTIHRMAYILDRPAPTQHVRPEPAPTDNAEGLFFYELARDQDDADYTPRTLIQTDTSLAA
jgi:predicted DNA-binding transcriptional regulator YafY